MTPVGNNIEIKPIPVKKTIVMEQPAYQYATVLQISPDVKVPFGINSKIKYVASRRVEMGDQVFLNTDFIVGYDEL